LALVSKAGIYNTNLLSRRDRGVVNQHAPGRGPAHATLTDITHSHSKGEDLLLKTGSGGTWPVGGG